MDAKTQPIDFQTVAYGVLVGVGADPAAYGIADALGDFFGHTHAVMPAGDFAQLVRSMFATAASCELGERLALVFPPTTPESLRQELVEFIAMHRARTAEEARHDQS